VPGDGQIVGGDMVTKISILFYSDARDALLKALGD
jgi:predicted ATP-dependent Lon-type protease